MSLSTPRRLVPVVSLFSVVSLGACGSGDEPTPSHGAPAVITAALGESDNPYLLTAPGTLAPFSATTDVARFVRLTVPANHDGLRIAVRSTADCDVIVRRGGAAGGAVTSAYDRVTHTFFFEQAAVIADNDWWLEIHPDASGTIDVQAEGLYARALGWDDGTTLLGTARFDKPNGFFGDALFRIVTEAPVVGLWRNVLRVSSGEADLFISQGSFPSDYVAHSDRVGSDDYPLRGNEFGDNQTWYLRVRDNAGTATWQVVSGDQYVQDFGALDGSPTPHTLELDGGLGYFRTSGTATSPAWRLHADGATFYVDDTTAPLVRRAGPYVQADFTYQDEALIVPPYFSDKGYLVAVVASGSSVAVDSRNQPVIDPTTWPGATGGAFSFSLEADDDAGYGYRTFKVVVPLQQIAWEVKLDPDQPADDLDLYIAKDKVPSEWHNDAMSEAIGAADALSLVPTTLSDATFYVTVRGHGGYTLTSGNPEITSVGFTNDPGVVNDVGHRDQVGWRYYVIPNVPPPLGSLGWQLELFDHVPGTEIAIRRNAVPGHWAQRQQGNRYETQHYDYASDLGFLERPNHPADVWYIGVYQPEEALGAFRLKTGAITATDLDFNAGSLQITNQPSGRQRFFKVTVPADAEGWDLRVERTAGEPRMSIRGEILPEGYSNSTSPYPLPWYAPWQDRWQWGPVTEILGRPYTDVGAGVTTYEAGRFALTGWGNPLREGTFYVLVSNIHQYTLDGVPLSYTIRSRGVGAPGHTPAWTMPIATLQYDGGVASVTNVAARDLRFYKVTVPAGATSWHVELEPTAGEAMMALHKGSIPNSEAGNNGWQVASLQGTRRSKAGREHFYLYPEYNQTTIPAGDYYVAVGSEGTAGDNGSSIAAGSTASFTLRSLGDAPMVDANLVLGTPTTFGNEVLRYGEQKSYRVVAPAGTSEIEARFTRKDGAPYMGIGEGGVAMTVSQTYAAAEGGHYPIDSGDSILSIAAEEGTYTITVVGYQANNGTTPDADYDLQIVARGEATLEFNGGTRAVEQEPQTWKYFKVVVPAGALGWDLRLENLAPSSARPQIVIRRDEKPESVSSSYLISQRHEWASGEQWYVSQEMTRRPYGPYDPMYGGTYEGGRIAQIGMGSPLEPGTYWVGVTDTQSAAGATFTYEIHSRGVGQGQDAESNDWAIQVHDLTFDGGSDTLTLDPREVAYYRVEVPAGAKSWDVELAPTVGEAMLAVEPGHLPNGETPYWQANGTRRQKTGNEYFYLYPDYNQSAITAGTYYLAVGSEGQDPYSESSYIGTGPTTFTLTSKGEAEIDAAPAPLTTTPITWTNETLRFGEQKIYRFQVDDPFEAIELRFVQKTGFPVMALGDDRIPTPIQSYYSAAIGGDSYLQYNDLSISLSEPAGTYTFVVTAEDESPYTRPDATYDLEVAVVDPTLAFNGGRRAVVAQDPAVWRIFKVTVPEGALGWDLRLEPNEGDAEIAGKPRMVIRRDEAPTSFGSTYQIAWHDTWGASEQWAASADLSQRGYGPYDPVLGGEYEYGRRISMGMGSPLVPGTYFVGVSDGSGSSNGPMSYTIVSRGIGIGKDADDQDWEIQVQDLTFGTEITVENLAPRDNQYYRVQVPEGLASWSAELDPTLGEAMFALRQGHLPNAEAIYYYASDETYVHAGSRRQKAGKEYFQSLPRWDQNQRTAPGGTYYIAVAPEGQDPYSTSYIGTGPTSFKLKTFAPVPIQGGVSEIVETQPKTFASQTLPYGQVKYYRVRVPETVAAFEVRLANRVGDPWFAVTVEPFLDAKEPTSSISGYYGAEHGKSALVTGDIAEQIAGKSGDVTIAVYSSSDTATAGYNLVITPLAVQPLAWDDGLANVSLKNRESAYFKVEVPQDCDGVAQAGWIVSQATTQGALEIQVQKDYLPGDSRGYPTLITTAKETIIVPPYLEPGNWFVRVRGTGVSAGTVTTKEVAEQRHWTMPLAGQNANTPGLTHPLFADTGVDDAGQPIINQGSGDQGSDLGEGRFAFYRLTVPKGNGGLMRTALEAISGNPELYIRRGAAPTVNQMPYPYNQDLVTYRDERTTSSYGQWVTPNSTYGTELEPGEYWIAVYARGSQVRYRLRLDLGNVRTLTQAGGSVSSQQVVAGDMHFFKVQVPQSSTTQSSSTPLDWSLVFSQVQGDGIVYLREDVPPGLYSNVPDPASIDSYIADWNDDRYAYIYGLSTFPSIENTGTTTLSVPVVKPGTTYWLGVYAKTDLTYGLSSSVGANKLKVDGVASFLAAAQGNPPNQIVGDIPAGEQRLYRIDVAADGARYKHTAVASDKVEMYMSVGYVPPANTYANWYSSGANHDADYALDYPGGQLFNFPWRPGASYYLIVKNTDTVTQHFQVTLDGRLGTDDSDSDGLPDGWEYKYFGALYYNGQSDNDGDGLDNATEYGVTHTAPNNRDTDNDSVDDSLEVAIGSDPNLEDSDGDQVCDGDDSAPTDPTESGRIIRLYMHEYDAGTYGHNHGSNEHKSRLAAVFQRFSEPVHWIHIKGWDIDSADEVEVILNGRSLGFLPVGGNNQDAIPVMFAVDSNDLFSQSDNRLELRQKTPGETWGVADLGLMSYGDTFGADPNKAFDTRHPNGFDLVWDEVPDSLLEWRAFDLDAADDVSVTVDGQPYLDRFVATGDLAWSPYLQTPFVAADMGTGSHRFEARPKAGGDGTWQLVLNAQRPIYSQFGTSGYNGDGSHFYQAFRFLFPKKPGLRELVLQYYLSPGRVVDVADSARGDSTWTPPSAYATSPNQEFFSQAATQDTVTATRRIVDPEEGGNTFVVYLTYYGPCADRDSSGLLDCEEVCDDLDGDGYDGHSAYCPAGDDCDDGNTDVGASDNDADCDGVTSGEDCDDGDSTKPANDADCDGVTTANDCDDTDASMPTGDADCDGYGTGSDCDDTDPTQPANDADCDGVTTANDCNDGDASMPTGDADCDGYATANDCDDADADKPANDADCDGYASGVDCDDANANKPKKDKDCDGVATANDCDDNDPDIQECPSTCDDNDGDGHDKKTGDCPDGDDCNDNDAASTWRGIDADCDGVPTTTDCNDASAAVTRSKVGDADCDGVPTDTDCNDADPAVTALNTGDLDCDGVGSAVDCNDNNPAVTNENLNDRDCDGVPTATDCNDKSAAVKNTNVNDADCDLVATANDCNDNDATVKNTRGNDRDCDLVPTTTDCDDDDPAVRNTKTNDADCDLVPTVSDCDDHDRFVTLVRQNDGDCDGAPKTVDCNDADPTVTNVKTNDADCDLVPTATDCNDNNPAITRERTNDADCDLVPSDVDCDDHNAAVKSSNVNDKDCDGVATAVDCDDQDPTVKSSNAGDADCDGVGTAVDCDDGDAGVTASNVGDADCDTVGTAIDCDDEDPAVTRSKVGDADCDGVGSAVDCDDANPAVTATNAGDEDCDGVGSAVDCDDSDAAIRTTNEGDRDCDGVATAIDCDDQDALVTEARTANDRDCDGVSDPLDCGPTDAWDARTRAGDDDCDGVASELDCDDRNPRDTRVNTGDRDCDGVPTAKDCDDTDRSNQRRTDGDADCDGAPTGDDCDDQDPTVQACPVCDDADDDGHGGRSATCPKGDDCDDGDKDSTWRAVDGDCDGVLTADDCDDGDAESTVTAGDADCDGIATADDCDDADPEAGAIADDVDCDGVADGDDNCPSMGNPDQHDDDFDGVGDVCEPCALGEDSDADGVKDACDVCPGIADAGQGDRDHDGEGDACDDGDGDGVTDAADNCPDRANADQVDGDDDGLGDACDPYDVTVSSSADGGCGAGGLGWLGLVLVPLVGLTARRGARRASR